MNIDTLTALASDPTGLSKLTKKILLDAHFTIIEDHGSKAAYAYATAFEKTGATVEKLNKASMLVGLVKWARAESKGNGKATNGKVIDFGESASTARPCPARKDKTETKGLSQFSIEELRARYTELCKRETESDSVQYLKQSIYRFVKMLRNDEDPTELKVRRRSDGEKTKPYSMPLTDPMRVVLDAAAEKAGVSTAAYVRAAIHTALCAQKKIARGSADLFDDSKR